MEESLVSSLALNPLAFQEYLQPLPSVVLSLDPFMDQFRETSPDVKSMSVVKCRYASYSTSVSQPFSATLIRFRQ